MKWFFSNFKIMTFLIKQVNNLNNCYIWLLFFAYSVLVSLFIQLIALPLIFPNLHIGNGLLDGGDWIVYQKYGVIMANVIIDNGWENWYLRPEGFGIVGVVSAIYAFFGIFEPYILVPFFSVLHALGALCILIITQSLGVSRSTAFFSCLPYLIFPSSLLWLSQILKDVFTLNASLIMLLGMVLFFGAIDKKSIKSQIISQSIAIFLILTSLFLIFISRPYMIELSSIFILIFEFILGIKLLTRIFQSNISLINFAFCIFAQILILFLAFNINSIEKHFAAYSINQNEYHVYISKSDKEIKKIFLERNLPMQIIEEKAGKIINKKELALEILKDIYKKPKSDESALRLIPSFNAESIKNYIPDLPTIEFETYESRKWQNSAFLPRVVDVQMSKVNDQRNYFYLHQYHANTTFDYDVEINSAIKFIRYLPRAVQVGYFAPFPTDWNSSKSNKANLMHKVIALEMIFIYLAFSGFIIALFIWRKKFEFWLLIAFSLFYSLFPVYAFPNIGALVRYRYAAIMIIVALSLSAISYLYSSKIKSNHSYE